MARKKDFGIRLMSIPEKPKGVWVKEYSRDPAIEHYELSIGKSFKLWVSNGHIDYRGKWTAKVYPFANWPRELKATSADEAKAEALELAKSLVDPIWKALQAAE